LEKLDVFGFDLWESNVNIMGVSLEETAMWRGVSEKNIFRIDNYEY